MKRVFLDQLHWIALGRVLTGRDTNPAHRDALDLILYSIDQGLASFPLADNHYHETLKRGDPRSRQQLGSVMFQISKTHTMSGINEMIKPEAAVALARWHGLPEPTAPSPFGRGMKHAFGRDRMSYFSSPEAERAAIALHGADFVAEFFEEALIMGPPERLPFEEIARPDSTWGQKQLDGELEYAARLKEHGHTPQAGRDLVMAQEAIHALNVVNTVALEVGLPPVAPQSREEVESIVYAMPSKAALTRMRMSAHENANFKWEIGDLGDTSSLATASAYCDIVVTERKWGSILQRHQKHLKARVLTRLADLPAVLVSGSS